MCKSGGRREAFRAKALSIGRWFRGRRDFLQKLNLDVSTEELLGAERAFTYADLYAMVENGETIAWLTPRAFITCENARVRSWGQLDESCSFWFSADGKDIFALARSPEHLLEIYDFVLRLLAGSVVHSVMLHKYGFRDCALLNAPTLAYMMEQCQSLKALTLGRLISLQEDHIRVLGGQVS
jgi:hypothetical protein